MDLATREILGAARRARSRALSGEVTAAEVAVELLERFRGIGRRHSLPGHSDAEIDRLIAAFRETES